MICYWCGQPAVSRQDIPPKQFFKGMTANKLIKVPSCNEHNKELSWEESFLHAVISLNLGGILTVPSNVNHALKNIEYSKKNKKSDNVPYPVSEGDMVRLEISGYSCFGHEYEVDSVRVIKALEPIFRGLWWYESKKIFTGTLYLFEFKLLDFAYTNNDPLWIDISNPSSEVEWIWKDNGTDIFKYCCFRLLADEEVLLDGQMFIIKKGWVCFKFILQGFSAFALFDEGGNNNTEMILCK